MFKLEPPADDDLLVDDVKEWANDKYHYLMRYIDAFTTSMKKKKWDGLHYIDLFAGSGIKQVRGSNDLIWGSPLIAAQSPHPFAKLHLCEKAKNKHSALKARIEKLRPDSQIKNGDANHAIVEILEDIPVRSLSLAFLDPYGLHLAYDTLCRLADRRVDLIILFPDYMDVGRNWKAYYLNNPESNLDKCFGKGSNWRKKIEECPNDKIVDCLKEIYVSQINKLGYKYCDDERIFMQGKQPLYKLLFCSKHEAGLKIWQRISNIQPDGQRRFDFSDE